jgi:hypothetical protein
MKLALVTVMLAACGTNIGVIPINAAPHPMMPRPAGTVDLYTSGPPARPYIDVMYLEAEQQTDLSLDGTQEFFMKLRDRAGRLGCDGLVIGHPTNRVTGTLFQSKHDNTTSLSGLTATCIAYVDDGLAKR